MHCKAVCLSTASVYAPTFSFQGDKLLEQIRIRVSGRSSEHQESSRQERFVKPQLLPTRARQLPGRPLPRPQRPRGLWPLCPPPARWARSTGSGNLLFKESLAVSPYKSLSRACGLSWSLPSISGERIGWCHGWIFQPSQPEPRGPTTNAAEQDGGLQAHERAALRLLGGPHASPSSRLRPRLRGLSALLSKW